MGCRKHYAGSVPAEDSSVQRHLAIIQFLFSSKRCAREEAEEGNNLTSILLVQYFCSACPCGDLREGITLWSGVEWVSWGQHAQAYLLFSVLLVFCIACPACFLHGNRLHSPALTLTRHLWCGSSVQRVSAERREWKPSSAWTAQTDWLSFSG